MPPGPTGIGRVIAKDEIRDVIYQWSRGVARKDWDLVASCYTPDGQDNHGSVNGGVQEFLGWMKDYHAHIEQVIFYSTDILIEFVERDARLGRVARHQLPTARRGRARSSGPVPRPGVGASARPSWIRRSSRTPPCT
ncbi:nuclear transport factor 2 family protein [Parafrankia sp. EUN1f]|uniref:nuclear transport factor 2 family protein n=1 Tax=Parafrankia sp. EUN1f TaxID=102897 RepID=UPI0001C47409|nr:nuclear transport factor 2 family protein [Parafrankia sp. EUN1f]EFC86800.1 hypothetical protein FrEUN1fDRAFT_0051 [Parafrankia sp. EUN1f]